MEVKSMQEDFVTYKIFPSDPQTDLVELRKGCLESVMDFVNSYMWHHDHFVLNIEANKNLHGRVTIGDNIEDEWFIVSLLFEISRIHQDVVIQINDQDGEVLLIEAADHLPKWAQEPELTENRVFVYKGQVHLIPIAKSPAELTPIPTGCPRIEDAIVTVINFSEVTKAKEEVQLAIKSRFKSYPQDWSDLMHYGHFIVPKNMKRVLKPKFISMAVRLFYNRDPIDLKHCRLMKNFDPKNGLCKVGVKMTKCLFAMLSQQKFNPDKKAGWPILSPHDPDFKAMTLGAKLACGFEILANSKTHQGDLEEAFVQSLTNNGYFQGQLKGSKKYNEMLQHARERFESEFQSNVKSPSDELRTILENDSRDFEEELLPEDDESWLELQPETFDDMLRNHFRLKEENDKEKKKSKEEIPGEIKSFLKAMSDMKGVEDMQNEDDKIDFRPDEFENAFKKVLGINSDSESDVDLDNDLETEMSDYFSQMDEELKGTKVTDEEDDWNKPLDIDSKMLSNLMESFKNQNGLPGPASTILEPLGFDLSK